MYQQVVRNAEGEPMYIENVLDSQEEYEYWCEEMQMRADDPYYAQMREKEEWYNKALMCFEEKGITVPSSVVETLACELRRKKMEIEAQKALDELKPAMDFLEKYFPNTFEARYDWPTPEECGYVYIGFKDYSNRPYRDEVEAIAKLALEQDIYIEDYLSFRELKTR